MHDQPQPLYIYYSFVIVHMANLLLRNLGMWLTEKPRIYKEKKEDIKINSSFYILALNNVYMSVCWFMGSIKSISRYPFNALLKQMLIKEITELQDVCLWMDVSVNKLPLLLNDVQIYFHLLSLYS